MIEAHPMIRISKENRLAEDWLMEAFAETAAAADAELVLEDGLTLLTGPSDSGKAAALLGAARDREGRFFFHHAGLGGESADPDLFLWRLLSAIRTSCGFRDPVPMRSAVMREALPNWLARAAARQPFSIVLADGHELTGGGLEPALDWLPNWLPAGVSLAISVKPGPATEWFREHADRIVQHDGTEPESGWRESFRQVLDADATKRLADYLWVSRSGLSLREIQALLGPEAESALAALAPYVCSPNDRHILASTTVRELAAARSLADHGQRQRLHAELAGFFRKHDEPGSAGLAIWHLGQAGLVDELAERLCAEDWLARLAGEPGARFEAVRHWRRFGDEDSLLSHLNAGIQRGTLSASAILGSCALVESFTDKTAPREWYLAALAAATAAQDLAAQARAQERLGDHPDTDDGARLGLLKEAFQKFGQALGPTHASTLGAQHRLACHYEERDDLAAAIRTYSAALQDLEQAIAEDPARAVPWLANLAAVHKAGGQLKEADQASAMALKIAREHLGKMHPTTASCCDQLATIHYMGAQYATAEPLFREALEITQSAFGPEHAATAACQNNLASVLDARQQFEEAERLYRSALRTRLALHGEHHSDSASTLHNLATALESMGKADEAEQLFRRALDAWDKVSGQDSPAFATTLLSLADLLRDRGAWADAEPLYRSDIEIWRSLVGAQHPHTLAALSGLARLYVDGGKPELAEPLLMHVAETTAQVLGRTDSLYMEAIGLLAAVLRDSGRKPEARAVLEQALSAHDQSLGMLTAPVQKLRRLLDSLDTSSQQLH